MECEGLVVLERIEGDLVSGLIRKSLLYPENAVRWQAYRRGDLAEEKM